MEISCQECGSSSNGKAADASLGLPQGNLFRGRRSRRIVRSSRHGRHSGFLGVSRNLRRRHDHFVRGARPGPPARTHAAGRQEAAARFDGLLADSVHALDRCRARSWPFPLERRRARLAARHLPVCGRGRLCPGTMGYAREPVFLLSDSYPDRPRPVRYHHGTLRLRPPSRIYRRDSDHSGKRTRARIVAGGRARCDLQSAVSAPSRYHGGPNSSGRAYGLFGLRRASSMAARPGYLVRANLTWGSTLRTKAGHCLREEASEPCLKVHEAAVLWVPANVCSWGKSGRAADIIAMTEFDPTATLVEPKSCSAAGSARRRTTSYLVELRVLARRIEQATVD